MKQSNNDLIDRLKNFQKEDRVSYDLDSLGEIYGKYFIQYPDDLCPFYNEIVKQDIKIKGWFMGNMANTYIKNLEENIKDKNIFYYKLIELYYIFDQINSEEEESVKLRIANALEKNHLREKDTVDMDLDLFTSMKKLVIDLSSNPLPERYKDGSANFDVGLNTTKGVGTLLVCILAFYFPKDNDLVVQIKKLSGDENTAIQAYLIRNLPLLVGDEKNYPLCVEIVNKFKLNNVVEIDQALIKYLFRLGNKKLEENLDFLENIIKRGLSERINAEAGSLVGQALLHQAGVEELFDKILKHEIGSIHTVDRIAFAFQNTLWKQLTLVDIQLDQKNKLLKYYKQILSYSAKEGDGENTGLVIDRASFVFYGKELSCAFFSLFKDAGIFDKVIETKHIKAIQHLNTYFLRCIDKEEYIGDIITLLEKEIELVPNILDNDRTSRDIADIINVIHDKYNGKPDIKVVNIFDKGLMHGREGFYGIFNRRYKG